MYPHPGVGSSLSTKTTKELGSVVPSPNDKVPENKRKPHWWATVEDLDNIDKPIDNFFGDLEQAKAWVEKNAGNAANL